MSRPTVLLADDHPIMVEGLKSLLQADFDLIGVVSDGQALVEAAERLQPDIIVSDISMPHLSGLVALQHLRQRQVRSRVVFLTVHHEPHLAAHAFRAGASAYLIKESAGEELTTAIREILRGRTYLTPRIAQEVMALLLDPAAEPAGQETQLTARQQEVLALIARGKRMKEIAAALQISVRTVEAHRYQIMRTFGIQSTAELVRYAIGIGLVPPADL